jgi:CRP-like cAMP-binding protein
MSNQNKLLGALPAAELEALQPDFERIELVRGDIIHRPGESIKYVYFPESCIVSMVTIFDDGASVESGIIGHEGMTGASVTLLNLAAAREAFVQTSGQSLRMKTEKFRSALERGGAFQAFVLTYISTFFEQVAQAGACSNHHSLGQRLARLLLMYHDRINSRKIIITHDFIAHMLGAYRPSVTLAAINFKERGLINYHRGVITIINKKGLENAACECYQIINESYRQYLSLLELRSLNTRMDQVNQKLAAEIQSRREIENVTAFSVENLHRAGTDIKNISCFFTVCRKCRRMLDDHGHWLAIDNFTQTKLNANLNYSFCPACSENNHLKFEPEVLN